MGGEWESRARADFSQRLALRTCHFCYRTLEHTLDSSRGRYSFSRALDFFTVRAYVAAVRALI